MAEETLIGLAAIIVIGIGAQWLAWRARMPSILLLLVCGIVAGPVTGFIVPDELLGHLLLPIVSIFVAIILFEGGLTLKFGEFMKAGNVVFNLVTLGLLSTWVISASAGRHLLGLNAKMRRK